MGTQVAHATAELHMWPANACSMCLQPAATGAALLVCSGCRGVRYCSQNCQRQHWTTHKTLCNQCKALVTMVDHIVQESTPGPLRCLLHAQLKILDCRQGHEAALAANLVQRLLEAIDRGSFIGDLSDPSTITSLKTQAVLLLTRIVSYKTEAGPPSAMGICQLDLPACVQFARYNGIAIILSKILDPTDTTRPPPGESAFVLWMRQLGSLALSNARLPVLGCLSSERAAEVVRLLEPMTRMLDLTARAQSACLIGGLLIVERQKPSTHFTANHQATATPSAAASLHCQLPSTAAVAKAATEPKSDTAAWGKAMGSEAGLPLSTVEAAFFKYADVGRLLKSATKDSEWLGKAQAYMQAPMEMLVVLMASPAAFWRLRNGPTNRLPDACATKGAAPASSSAAAADTAAARDVDRVCAGRNAEEEEEKGRCSAQYAKLLNGLMMALFEVCVPGWSCALQGLAHLLRHGGQELFVQDVEQVLTDYEWREVADDIQAGTQYGLAWILLTLLDPINSPVEMSNHLLVTGARNWDNALELIWGLWDGCGWMRVCLALQKSYIEELAGKSSASAKVRANLERLLEKAREVPLVGEEPAEEGAAGTKLASGQTQATSKQKKQKKKEKKPGKARR